MHFTDDLNMTSNTNPGVVLGSMDFTEIITILKDASPWVVLGAVVFGVVWLYFDYRKTRLDYKQKQAERSEFAQVLEGITEFKAQLQLHTNEDQRMISGIQQANLRMAEGMEQVVRQLINLNASTTGKTLSPANSRTIIQYQWLWCRDETIKILLTSIERNHIEGREQAVAAQVFRAWKRAAADARLSVERFEGLAYDLTVLFNATSLNKIWKMCWEKALPIYFRDFAPGSGSLEDHRTDLLESVKYLFDQAFEEFVASSYEVDHGTDSRWTKSDANIPANTEDLHAVEQMVKDMRGYRPGSGKHLALYPPDTGNQDKLAMRTTVEAAVKASQKRPKING